MDPDESESDGDAHEDQSDEHSDGDGPSPTLVSEASDEEGSVGAAREPAGVSFTGGRFALLNAGAVEGDESEDEDELAPDGGE